MTRGRPRLHHHVSDSKAAQAASRAKYYYKQKAIKKGSKDERPRALPIDEPIHSRDNEDSLSQRQKSARLQERYNDHDSGNDIGLDDSDTDFNDLGSVDQISSRNQSKVVAELLQTIRNLSYCQQGGDLDVYLLGRLDGKESREWVIEDLQLDLEDAKLMLGKAQAVVADRDASFSSIWPDLWPEVARVTGILQGATGKLELLIYLLHSGRI